MLKKDLAGFFAFFLGVFGVHRFYLGQWWRGAAQFVGFWAIIAILAENGPEMPLPFLLVGMVLAPLITAVVFWATPYERWAAKYDPQALVAPGYTYPKTSQRPTMQSRQPRKPSLRALKAEGVKYYRAGDYDLAVEAFSEALDQAPTDPVAHFNIACCYALMSEFPPAIRSLEVAITYELPKPERIETHPALTDLRASEAYRTFRNNNYRRLNLLDLHHDQVPPHHYQSTREETEELEDNPDLLEQINRLRELREAGILTQTEYQNQRQKLH
ncbi:NINE protein [Lewinella sp. IMCC34191]|uniref:NINE protein n=1 Tax=Lewinella sp. IMCC34191 TaxID=2259172 RepID=UPI0018E593AA|nr:NINE protein [Lewinella sp. IMCC34191]